MTKAERQAALIETKLMGEYHEFVESGHTCSGFYIENNNRLDKHPCCLVCGCCLQQECKGSWDTLRRKNPHRHLVRSYKTNDNG